MDVLANVAHGETGAFGFLVPVGKSQCAVFSRLGTCAQPSAGDRGVLARRIDLGVVARGADLGGVEDDTLEILAKSEAKKLVERKEDTALMDIKDDVSRMDTEQLSMFAMTHYKQKLDRRCSVENLRSQVTQFVDQFGV